MRDLYGEAVREVVRAVPPGRVLTYGDIATIIDVPGLGGGPRQVGAVMSRDAQDTPWWRIVNSSGRLPASLVDRALTQWEAEGTSRSRSDDTRVSLARARWTPSDAELDRIEARISVIARGCSVLSDPHDGVDA